MNGLQSAAENHAEKVELLIYFVVVIFAGYFLFRTMGESWENSQLFRPIIRSFDPIFSITLEAFAAACIGLYVGLLVIFSLDNKKRWQGFLLWLGTAVSLIVLQGMGLLLPNVDLADNALLILLGMVFGAVSGGGRALLDFNSSEPLEFRKAGRLLFYFITTIVFLGLIEYHVTFPDFLQVTGGGLSVLMPEQGPEITTDGLFFNAGLALVFVYTLKEFVQYDAEETFLVLGPKGSGKSLFVIGMYYAALDRARSRKADAPLRPSGDLIELIDEFDAASQNDGWVVESTERTEIRELRFQYLSGRLFPKNLVLSSLDYAGEFLRDLPNALMADEENIDNEEIRLVARRVEEADTLIMLLDVERYENDDSLEIEAYFDILSATSGTEVLLVATKADILAERFKEEERLEAHQFPEEFHEYVNRELINNSAAVENLVEDASGSEIYPVYYQTKSDGDDERIPLRDEHGQVEPVGFDVLLERIG